MGKEYIYFGTARAHLLQWWEVGVWWACLGQQTEIAFVFMATLLLLERAMHAAAHVRPSKCGHVNWLVCKCIGLTFRFPGILSGYMGKLAGRSSRALY